MVLTIIVLLEMFQKQQYYKTESLKYEDIPGTHNV